MHQVTARRPIRPATIADVHRLADLADARGVDVLQDCQGRWMATSARTPGLVYALTGFSCTCPGFVSHGRCSHHALLLRRLGWLPELEAALESALESALPFVADDVETVTCRSCTNGRIQEWTCGHPSGFANCDVCAGSGRVPVLPAVLPAEQPARVAA